MASKYVYGRSVPTAYLRQKHRISRYVHTITSYEPSMLLPTANLRQKYNHYNYVETLSLFKSTALLHTPSPLPVPNKPDGFSADVKHRVYLPMWGHN